MKTIDQWFEEYSENHKNHQNKQIHYICVPAIFFSVVGLIMSIPATFLSNLFKLNQPIIENWATVVLLFVLIFYIRLSLTVALKMAVFSIFCIVLNFYISQIFTLWLFSIVLFTIAWLGQFYGHKLEGKSPSFLKDIQFLLIGPAWVANNLFSKKATTFHK